MGGKRKRDEAVFRRLLRLAEQKSNDAVRLAFLKEEDAGEIMSMELGALTELKRHGNGAVEIKLVDRVEIYEKLREMAQGDGDETLEAFLAAAGGGTSSISPEG